jgi:hypothetical protein
VYLLTHVTLTESSGHFTSQVTSLESQESSVNIVTGLQFGPRNRGSILGRRNRGLGPADQAATKTCSTKVKNEWRYTSIAPHAFMAWTGTTVSTQKHGQL